MRGQYLKHIKIFILDCTDGYSDQCERHSDFHNPYYRYQKNSRFFFKKSGGGEVKKVIALTFSKMFAISERIIFERIIFEGSIFG